MSKTITKKRSKSKEVDPKFGVSDWDPAELDVRHTRHGTYDSRPPPKGGTWKEQIKEEAYRLRQRQREEESPEFISPHSTTDTMDTDEAQEINRQIKERMEKEPEGAEYLNVLGEERYENVGSALDTGPTFSTVSGMQAQAEKAQETYEEIEGLEDSGIVSFPKIDKDKEAIRRKTQGERVPFETEDIIASLTSISGPPPMAFTDPADFDEVIKEGDEYLSKVEQGLGNEEKKQIQSRIEKGYAKTVKWETINFPLSQIMKYHLRLPFPHAPKVLSRNPKMWVNKTPVLEHPAVLIAIPEWEGKFRTKSYAVDVREGYIYALRGEDWERLIDRAYVATDEPLEVGQVTPIAKELSSREIQTLDSKEKVPIAESTRKDVKEFKVRDNKEAQRDFLESEPRQGILTREIQTPVRKLSFSGESDEDTTEEIDREIKETEVVQQALEEERMQIERERISLERERQRIVGERLKALRQQRKRLEDSIIKMSNEMVRDEEITTQDRRQRRINMENEYLNQIDLEEAAIDDYFPVLKKVEEIQPDVMTTDSQISSTVDPIEFMDEEALMKLKLKNMRAEQCRSRTHKMYKLFLESATDPKKKEGLEHMLLATITNLDRKMSKFKEGLDNYDQKEQYVLSLSEKLQIEQEKALKEQRELQKVLQGLQEKHTVAARELEALQKEKEESDLRKKEMEDKINQERKAKIWREQRLEEERQKLRDLEKLRRQKGSLKGENKDREEQDRLLAEKLAEKEKKERELKDKRLAEQIQKKQRLERDEQEKLLAEQLLEKERQEEEMMRIKREQEQLDWEELMGLEQEKQFKLTKEQENLQREELERLEKEHQKTLDKEKREKEKRKTQRKINKPTEKQQQQEKDSLLDALNTVVNGYKPNKPKDLGWDYQKDKDAKRVFERKKELQKQKEKERRIKLCSECRYPKHPGECPCKKCGKQGHQAKDCPKTKPPKIVPEPVMDFCIECMVPHPPGRCICKLCKTIGHIATECPWLEEAKATAKPPKLDKRDEEPEVLFCLHCRSDTHKMEDCAAYKVAQAKMKKVWCENCKQYGHTIAECMDEKREQRNKEIERRREQLEEIDRKMEQVKRQAEKDIGKPPQDRDTRDYPVGGGRRPKDKPKKAERDHEPPPPPREGPPSGPPAGGAGGGEPPGGDDSSEPADSDSDEEDEEDSDSTEATEESGFLYDEEGKKIDINQLYKEIRKRKKRTAEGGDELPIKVVRGPRGHRGSKGRTGRKGPPGDTGVSQTLERSVDANVTIDTAGLEKTFRDMGESMKDVFTSQQMFNRSMRDTLEASTKAQEKQTEALEKLNISTKQRDHDHMFATIKPYDGKDPKEFDAWIEQIMTACKISGRNPKMVALTKSTGAVTEVILSMKQNVTWIEFVEELRRCFSDSKTRVHAAAIYNEFRRQDDNENLRSYIHKYTRLHREATGKGTDEEFDTHNKLHFLSRLRNSTIATKISQSQEFERFDKYSLKNCIEKALMLESRLQIREMVMIARENLENKDPKVLEMTEEGDDQQEEFNILSEDKGPGRFTNPNLANLICYKCGGYGHYGRDCPEANQAMDQLEDRIVGRIEHSFNAYTPVTLQYMNDMIVKAAKLEVSRRLAKKKLEKLKNQKGGDPQDKTRYPIGRGRGQAPRPAQQATRPPLAPSVSQVPAQQVTQPTATRGRGRGGANVVAKKGGRQTTPPPQDPQQTIKKVTFQQPAQVEVKTEPKPIKVGLNPFLQPHLPELHEMTETWKKKI